MTSFKEDLKIRFKSGDPLLYIRSNEIFRTELVIREILSELNDESELTGTDQQLTYHSWSADKGWLVYSGNSALPKVISGTEIINTALQKLVEDDMFSGVYVLPFGHLFFDPHNPNIELLQTVLDISTVLKGALRKLIIISPVFQMCKEIENLFTLIDFQLPPAEELLAKFDNIVENIKTLAIDKYGDEEYKSYFEMPTKEVSIECAESALGLTEYEAENIFFYTLYKSDSIPRKWNPSIILNEKANVIKKTGFLEYFQSNESFDTVGGLDNLKEYVEKRIKGFSQEAKDFGLKYPKGILLGGPPGVGKSLTVKALANNFNVPLIKFDVGKIMGSLLGEASRNIYTVMNTVETIGKVILWIDEIEKALGGMAPGQISDSAGAEVARTLGAFLTWLQERDKSKMIYVIGSCNNVLALPPELTRKGRFDEFFWVDFPTQDERKEILNIHLKFAKRDHLFNDEHIEELAKLSQGYNGAELEEAVNTGLHEAFNDGTELQFNHLVKAIEETTPLSFIRKEEMIAMRQWSVEHNVRKASSQPAEDLNEISNHIQDRITSATPRKPLFI